MSEKIAFSPRISTPTFLGADGRKCHNQARANLTFPNVESAVNFLNIGAAPDCDNITVEGIRAMRETTTGAHNEYDAYVTIPDRETGEVSVTLQRWAFGNIAATAALSEFVVSTIEETLGAYPQELIGQ